MNFLFLELLWLLDCFDGFINVIEGFAGVAVLEAAKTDTVVGFITIRYYS